MSSENKENKCALKPDQFQPFKLVQIFEVNHNSKIFRFALDKYESLNLPVASCIVVKANCGKDGAEVIRPYTPMSDNSMKGSFDLLVKIYPNGNMSKHIGSMKVGDTLDMKGPFPKVAYKANMKKKIGMIAGGTGITPMLQVLNEIVKNPEDKTEVSLLFANIALEDILLKSEIDHIVAKHSNIKVHYVLEKPPQDWTGSVGYVTSDIIQKYMPAHSDDSVVYVCGPPPMMNAISGDKNPDKSQGPVTGILKNLGYDSNTVYKF